eukprot:Nk52_evm97s208 gene=Nk52_evmTU97s208
MISNSPTNMEKSGEHEALLSNSTSNIAGAGCAHNSPPRSVSPCSFGGNGKAATAPMGQYQNSDSSESCCNQDYNYNNINNENQLLPAPAISGKGLYKSRRALVASGIFLLFIASSIIYAYFTRSTGSVDGDMFPTFGFQDVFRADMKPLTFEPNWLPTQDGFAQMEANENGNVRVFNCSTGEWRTLVNKSRVLFEGKQVDYDGFWVSPSSNHVLLSADREKIYRHSFYANYFVFDVNTEEVTTLTAIQSASGDDDQMNMKPRLAVWSNRGDSIAFVKGNNVYVKNKGEGDKEKKITDTGKKTVFFNGVPSWTYEEEVFSTNTAMWWSPNDERLAFLAFNETFVDSIHMTMYSANHPYDHTTDIAYPKPGYSLPQVTAFVYDRKTDQVVELSIQPNGGVNEEDYYVTNVAWSGVDHVAVTRMNRYQNTSTVLVCDMTKGGACSQIHKQESRAWLEDNHSLRFTKSGMGWFDIEVNEGFAHIIAHTKDDKKPRFLSNGQFEVEAILGLNEESRTLFYSSTEKDQNGLVDSTERHIWKVNYETAKRECISCEFGAGWYRAKFSPTCAFFVLLWDGPDVPKSTLHRTAEHSKYTVLEHNEKLHKAIEPYQKTLPHAEYFEINTADMDNGPTANTMKAVILKPHDFSETTKYPVIVEVYGGPGSQKVMKKFNLGWHTYLVSSRNYLHVMVDGRGTGFRGTAYRHAVYRQLGVKEADDQVAMGEYLKTLPYVDSKDLTIWGWSYGGFMAASVTGHEKNPFARGISVAPVTSWMFYDAVYTERYMSTPADNPKGYEETQVMKKVDNFKDSKYLLVHGTGDDNVHFQNSAALLTALTDANIDYRVQVYTNQTHRLDGGNTFKHLYRLLTQFLTEEKL